MGYTSIRVRDETHRKLKVAAAIARKSIVDFVEDALHDEFVALDVQDLPVIEEELVRVEVQS